MTATLTVAPTRPAPDTGTACSALREERALQDMDDVEAWLRTLSPGAVCGHAHDPGFCPLARYLAAQTGARAEVSVGAKAYRVGADHRMLPRWARDFVSAVDAVPARRARELGPGITAAEALEVLEGVMALEEARERLRQPLRVALRAAQGWLGP